MGLKSFCICLLLGFRPQMYVFLHTTHFSLRSPAFLSLNHRRRILEEGEGSSLAEVREPDGNTDGFVKGLARADVCLTRTKELVAHQAGQLGTPWGLSCGTRERGVLGSAGEC